ncbi:hypothetical protein FD724_22085 [Nostoc sp. C057]|uniref:hypothetical protein n=1 Tax=Nostoc sp. C057 TaxID=2576903 RepID=UPI0015C2DB57|nr:hypothetical protein [Nostoc sp. C057]QLE50517.1 hypothetical protein FD724_22085 [Nostoc sp. C057]
MTHIVQYGSVKGRDAINRRLYNNQSFVETAIYRVFVDNLFFAIPLLHKTVPLRVGEGQT